MVTRGCNGPDGINIDPAAGADPEYVSALLNSNLLTWCLKRLSRAWRGGWFEGRKGNLSRLPIAVPSEQKQRALVKTYRDARRAVQAEIQAPDNDTAKRLCLDRRIAVPPTAETILWVPRHALMACRTDGVAEPNDGLEDGDGRGRDPTARPASVGKKRTGSAMTW